MAMHELSDESDNLFREIQSISNAEGSLEPLINIREEASEFIISADLPFVKKEGITIYTTERSLEIQARMYKDVTFEKGVTIQREISFNSFHRTMTLPSEIIPEEAKAAFRRGVLIVRLPRKMSRKQISFE